MPQQIFSSDTLACCWDVKQPPNNHPTGRVNGEEAQHTSDGRRNCRLQYLRLGLISIRMRTILTHKETIETFSITAVKGHMHGKLKLAFSPTCPCGQEDQTTEHVSTKMPPSQSYKRRCVACQHSPDDQTLRLQAGAEEDDVIHLPSGPDRVDWRTPRRRLQSQ